MNVDVVVPWRGGCPHRQAALDWVQAMWATADVAVTLAEAPAGEWCKAAAVTLAVERSTAELIVVADADVWCDDVDAAVGAVRDGAPWAIPHLMVRRLDEASTVAVLAGGELGGKLAQRPYVGHAGGGIVVLRRSTYLDVPLDARFVGWGHEDDAWALALTKLVGRPWRGVADLWHLHHPTQPRKSRGIGSESSLQLWRRYRRARTVARRMRALVDEQGVRP